jgi:hypothetical protein
MNSQGTAQIQVPGHYKAWRIGKHKNRELALVQVAPVDIIRDKNRNGKLDEGDEKEHSQIGVNQHSASDQKLVWISSFRSRRTMERCTSIMPVCSLANSWWKYES